MSSVRSTNCAQVFSPSSEFDEVESNSLSFRETARSAVFYVSKHPRCIIWTLAVSLFLLGFFIRLVGIEHDSPQPDELHWLTRSADSLAKYRQGDLSRINFHLAHPGVPPSTLYSIVIWAVEKYNNHYGLTLGSQEYVDYLAPCRIANAFVSSLIFPLIFLGLAAFTGYQLSTLTTLLLILSPTHVAASRVVHLDTLLTLFITAAWIFFIVAEKKNFLSLKLLSGFFWGLAVATKPTAGFILPALYSYRAISSFFEAKKASGINERTDWSRVGRALVPRWSDLWTLFIGHAVLALTWSRMWHYHTPYITDFHLDNLITRGIDHLALAIHSLPSLFHLLLIIGIISGFRAWKLRDQILSHRAFHFNMASLLISVIGLFAMFIPSALANFIRFWMRAAGLSFVSHVAYGQASAAPHFGYSWLLATRLPLVILLGFVFLIFLAFRSRTFWRNQKVTELSFLTFALIASICWFSFLSISAKQTMRYALPVIPLLYAISSQGLLKIYLMGLSKNDTSLKYRPLFFRALAYTYILGLLLVQSFELHRFHPYYGLFRNYFSGGLKTDIELGVPLPPVGIRDALDYISQEMFSTPGGKSLLVLGDIELTNYVYTHSELRKQRGKINFINYTPGKDARFLIVFPGFKHAFNKLPEEIKGEFFEVFSYAFQNQDLLSVFKKDFPNYHSRQIIRYDGAHNTGQIRHVGKNQFLWAETSKHKKGYLFFGTELRFQKGSYRFHLPLSQAKQNGTKQSETLFSSAVPVLNVEIGKECLRTVNSVEVTDSENVITWDCVFPNDSTLNFRVYWLGNMDIKAAQMSIENISG